MKNDRRRTNTKERIFLAALTLFAEKGVDATSVRDITGAVGLSVAAFYNHFDSKDTLLSELYRHFIARIPAPQTPTEQIEKVLDDIGPVEFLVAMFEGFVVGGTDPDLARLAKVISMEKEKNETAAEIARADRQKLIEGVQTLFRTIADHGYLVDRNAERMGRVFAYAILGVMEENKYFLFVRGESPEEVIRRQS